MIEVDLNVLICSTVTQQPQLSATWLAQLSQSHMGESQEKEKKRKEKNTGPQCRKLLVKSKNGKSKATLVWCCLGGIVSREAVVWSHGGSVVFLSLVCIHLVGRKEVGCKGVGDLGDHVDDLVLGLGRDLLSLLSGLGSLCAHVGTLGESAKLGDE